MRDHECVMCGHYIQPNERLYCPHSKKPVETIEEYIQWRTSGRQQWNLDPKDLEAMRHLLAVIAGLREELREALWL